MTDNKMKNDSCVFCKKIESEKLAKIGGCVVFEPLNPVVKGHVLVVPIKHVKDFSEDIETSARVAKVVSICSRTMDECNIITSKGENATQTIRHLHVHIVPRTKDDGLKLPWSEE